MLKYVSLTIITDVSELTDINVLSGNIHSHRAVWNKKLCENKGAVQIRH